MKNIPDHNSGIGTAVAESRARGQPLTDLIGHLYVHIPFCARICPYCAFYKDRLDRSQTNRFCQALLAEIEQQRERVRLVPETIYFGGGTPTALTTSQLRLLLTDLGRLIDLSNLREMTVEANPGSVSLQKATLLRRLGANRISLGVQSWENNLLVLLGREHNAAQAEESFRIFREAGFENINIDLMFGLPNQTITQWKRTLEKTLSLQPEHISAYCLTYEEDTDFFLRHSRGELRSDPDADADFFELAMTLLEDAGYRHYEISNYARENFASRHNRAYWQGADYLGIGPSAFSTVGLQRLQNIADYREYSDRALSGRSPVSSVEVLTPKIKQTEKIALCLRTGEGIPVAVLAEWPREAEEFISLGLLRRTNGNFVLTRAGKSVADSVASAFV